MKTLIAAALALALVSTQALATQPPAGVDLAKIASHLKDHQQYPATRKQLLEACYDLKDFSAAEKKWFLGNLPDQTFRSADEVVSAVLQAK